MNHFKITWDLSELKTIQSNLDSYIHNKKNTSYQQTITERKLALMVELNELANTTKCFKYWSENKNLDHQHILEEYVDGLHFSLSLLIYYDLKPQFEINAYSKADDQKLSAVFCDLNQSLDALNSKKQFVKWFASFLELAYYLGFSQEQVQQAYLEKNKVNYQRQNSGY